MSEKKDINVVLSGGSARGLAHLGVLSVLEKHFKIKSVIGTSMGAIIGGFYAYGYSTDEIVEMVKDIKPSKMLSVFRPSFNISGLFDGKAILKYFEEKTKNVNIENCKISFAAAAFDMSTAKTIILDKGNLAKALRASSALPLIIEPFPYGKYLFVDGYIEHPFPLKFANHFEKRMVVASSIFPSLPQPSSIFDSSDSASDEDKPSMFNVFFKSTLYSQTSMALQATIMYKPDIYISCFSEDLHFWDLDEVDEFYNIGKKSAEKRVKDYMEDEDSTLHDKFFDNLTEKYKEVSDYLKGVTK